MKAVGKAFKKIAKAVKTVGNEGADVARQADRDLTGGKGNAALQEGLARGPGLPAPSFGAGVVVDLDASKALTFSGSK